MGPRAVLLRPELLSFEGLSATLPRRNVMWLLPRRAESRETAGESRGAPMENLSSTVGAQYFWTDRIFAWNPDPSSFYFQILHASRPGSIDTSQVSSDNINNPRTMNAVYNLSARLEAAKRWGRETLGPDNLANKQFNDFVSQRPLTQFFQPPNT